jgi:cell division protein FtsN
MVQRIELESRGIFYRVLVQPFSDLKTAEAFCNRLRSWEQDCLILHENLSSIGQPGVTDASSRDP